MSQTERMHDFILWMENKVKNVHTCNREAMLRALEKLND
jgi:hypothetical protein